MRGTELERGDRQYAGTAAEVDQGFVSQVVGVEPFQTQGRCRMCAGAEREA